ncbi:right-handed parallel beta-helix repeat-containing protein [Chryseobacterium sp. MYb328]|uniref:right-handed parallel beta-helix repeat-containing protein n=1 Tax=Chryseobacterium sp. MYb328 TaxID=2745231 RepID=UPI0030AF4913
MKSNTNYKIIFFLFVVLPLNIFAQFQYKKIDRSFLPALDKKTEIRKIKSTLFTNAKDLTDYLPKDFSKRGDVNYTKYLQKGIDDNKKIILPDFPVMIDFGGLRLSSNSYVLFQENSKLLLQPNKEELYGMLYIEGVENVNVYFANLVGDRDKHQGDKGEWGMGFFIRNSKNVKIYNPTITNMWGDGIYIGNLNKPSEKIEINYAVIDNNRRNGISIVAGENILVKNSLIANTNGTIPQSGIDIEPNNTSDYINNISLDNIITYNNADSGLIFALDNLQGNQLDRVKIDVNNFVDYFSNKGIDFYVDRGYNKYIKPLKGTINIKNIKLFNNKNPIRNSYSAKSNMEVYFQNINIDNKKINTNNLDIFVQKIKNGEEQTLK